MDDLYRDEEIIVACQQMIDSGRSRAEILDYLKKEKCRIIQAIKISKIVFDVSLSDAKKVCASSEHWRLEAAAAEPLHDELERLFRACSAGGK